jgi:hypothetical protein
MSKLIRNALGVGAFRPGPPCAPRALRRWGYALLSAGVVAVTLSKEGETMLLTAILACTECVDWFLCYWYGYC